MAIVTGGGSNGGRGSLIYDFYNGRRSRIRQVVVNPNIGVYDRYVNLYRSLLSSRPRRPRTGNHPNHNTDHAQVRTISNLSVGVLAPTRVGGKLSRCIVNRSRTGHILTISICGRCGHVLDNGNTSIRLRGSGILLLNPSNINGALLTRALTGVLKIPFTVTSTAALARTNCINRSIRGVLLGLLRTTSFSIRGTRINVVCVSRVSGVAHGDRGPSVAHSINNRNIRRTLLGVLRNAIDGIPPGNNHGRPRRRFVRVSAAGVLFVYNNTFSNLSGCVLHHASHSTLNFNDDLGSGSSSTRHTLLHGIRPRSLIGFNLVPRLVNHLPIVAILSSLSRSTLIHILGRPHGDLIGRCGRLLDVSDMRLRFASRTLRTVTHGAVRHGANTHNLHDIVRNVLLPIVCSIPGSSAVVHIAVSGSAIRNNRTRLRCNTIHGQCGGRATLD